MSRDRFSNYMRNSGARLRSDGLWDKPYWMPTIDRPESYQYRTQDTYGNWHTHEIGGDRDYEHDDHS